MRHVNRENQKGLSNVGGPYFLQEVASVLENYWRNCLTFIIALILMMLVIAWMLHAGIIRLAIEQDSSNRLGESVKDRGTMGQRLLRSGESR